MSLVQRIHRLAVATRGRGLYDCTREIVAWVDGTGIVKGLLTVYIRHTSASLLVQENYDPEVQRDLERFFARLVKDGDTLFEHTIEGPDDMPAHVRASLTQVSLSIPVLDARPVLGTWQGIYVYEHRLAPQRRELVLHLLGEP